MLFIWELGGGSSKEPKSKYNQQQAGFSTSFLSDKLCRTGNMCHVFIAYQVKSRGQQAPPVLRMGVEEHSRFVADHPF